MRYFLLCSVALMLMTACSEDKPQEMVAEATAQAEQQVKEPAGKNQETPSSLSGNELHIGPNPHAQLNTEQQIAVALRHAEEGRMAEALDVLTRAIAASPNDASLIAARGGLLLSQDRVYDALVDLEKAVALAPDSALLLVNRSQAYRKFNRFQEAMDDLNKAAALSPKLVPVRFNRGVLLYEEGNYNEALADFNVCIQVAPQTAGPYFNRAVTRDALGDHIGAVSDMNKFIELADNPEWEKVAQDTLAAWEKESK